MASWLIQSQSLVPLHFRVKVREESRRAGTKAVKLVWKTSLSSIIYTDDRIVDTLMIYIIAGKPF